MLLRANNRGDTLVEVVIAMAILAGVLISILHLASIAYETGIQARERIEAATSSQAMAEMLRRTRDAYTQACQVSSPNCGSAGGANNPFTAACTPECHVAYNNNPLYPDLWQIESGPTTTNGQYSTYAVISPSNGPNEITYTINTAWTSIAGQPQTSSMVLTLANTVPAGL